MLVRTALLTLLLLTLAATAQAQPEGEALPDSDPEAGRPFITTFGPEDYSASRWITSVTEDERGVLYAGSGYGVLEYDGATWRLISLPGGGEVQSLARGRDGRIFVGGDSELGYLAPDSLGQTTFVSLLEEVPEPHRSDVGLIYQAHATDEGIYFNADGRLFRWDGQEMQVWTGVEDGLHVSAVVDGTLYIRGWGQGLLRMEETSTGDSLRLVPGSERFSHTRIYVMLPFDGQPISDGGRMLIGTREEGLFLWDGERFEPFDTEADEILESGGLYFKASALPGGRFALGTHSGDLVVIDRAGRLLRHLDEESGLPGGGTLSTYEDAAGDLWVAQIEGLARVELSAPFTRYGAESGYPGPALDLIRHEGRLYAGHYGQGITYLEPGRGVFLPVGGAPPFAPSLLSVQGDLLVAADDAGVFRIRDDGRGVPRAEPVRRSESYDFRAQALHAWSRDSSVVFVGLLDGLAVLQKTEGGWSDAGRVPGIDGYRWFIAEGTDGAVWLYSPVGRPVRVRLAEPGPDGVLALDEAEVTTFGPEHGLPDRRVTPQRVGGEVYFTAWGERVLRFDENTGRFVEDDTFDEAKAGHPLAELSLNEVDEARVWIASTDGAPVVAHPRPEAEGGGYTFERLRRFRADRIRRIYPEDDGVAWLESDKGVLIRFDTRLGAARTGAPPPLVRRVAIGGDSLLYGGTGEPAEARVSHGAGELRFAFAAPGGAEMPRYRTRLEAFDDDWSDWTEETERAYTNLPPGNYRFVVEAEGRGQADYRLAVLPPWYRTWWAYLLYALAALGLVASVVILRTRQLKARQRELEQIVEERTAELEQRVGELAVINSVQRGLVIELDMQAIYDLVGDRIRDLFDAQVVIIATFDHEADRERQHYLIEKGERRSVEPRPLDLLRQRLINEGEVIHIQEQFIDALVEMGQHRPEPVPGTEMPQSVLFVPLVVGDEVRGYVSLQNVDREHAFSDAEVRLLSTLTNSMSVALENARLFAETRQQAVELETVNRVSRALVSQLDFDTLVRLVGEQIRGTFHADIVYVALHDQDEDMVRFAYEYGDENADRPFGSGLTEKIITTREPLLINRDLAERRRQLKAQQIGKLTASYLGVPIMAGDEAIGVISVQSTEEENRFDADDLRLLGTIAANVGVALQNAEAYRRLNAALEELKAAQAQLVQQEKMASLGQLTAGIAHEIKNPLNFVNNFAQLTAELVDELGEELRALNGSLSEETREEITFLLKDLRTNASKIEEHGRRADGIVKSMLQHSRGGKGERQRVEFNPLVEEYVGLSYHGMRAANPEFNSAIERDYDESVGEVEMLPQEIGRVLINLLNNAFYAVHERAQQESDHQPEVRVATRREGGTVTIEVADNGPGIPEDVREKVFEPFFTTKPTGEGTGLGLSMSYDIVTQGHGGTMTVEAAEGEGTTFRITLPATPAPAPEPAGSASSLAS